MNSSKKTARLAGLFWLMSALTGGFGLSYIRSSVIVLGDAAATAGNIRASELLFRAAIVGLLLGQVFYFFVALELFHLFKDADRKLATLLLGAAILTVGIAVANTLNHFGALMILSQADFLKVFTHEQTEALALVFLRQANGPGQGLIEIFWAPFYLSFGLLVIRSRYLPQIIGILLMVMGVGFAINILQKFLIPQFHPLMFTRLAMTFGALGGIPTMLWLLIKGVRAQQAIGEA